MGVVLSKMLPGPLAGHKGAGPHVVCGGPPMIALQTVSDAGGNRKQPKRAVLTFRVEGELVEKLDAIAAELRSQGGLTATRSMVARTILASQLGMDPIQTEVGEVLANVTSVVQWAFHQITVDVVEKLPNLVREGQESLQRGDGLPSHRPAR